MMSKTDRFDAAAPVNEGGPIRISPFLRPRRINILGKVNQMMSKTGRFDAAAPANEGGPVRIFPFSRRALFKP